MQSKCTSIYTERWGWVFGISIVRGTWELLPQPFLVGEFFCVRILVLETDVDMHNVGGPTALGCGGTFIIY